jgi:hypothetical protein
MVPSVGNMISIGANVYCNQLENFLLPSLSVVHPTDHINENTNNGSAILLKLSSSTAGVIVPASSTCRCGPTIQSNSRIKLDVRFPSVVGTSSMIFLRINVSAGINSESNNGEIRVVNAVASGSCNNASCASIHDFIIGVIPNAPGSI